MIVVDDENSGERSPLKSGPTSPNLPSHPAQPPPPPPYAAAAAHHHSYHSITPGFPLNNQQQATVLVLQGESPLKRFLRALGVALIILFLWSLFIDSLNMAFTRRYGGFNDVVDNADSPHGIQWFINDWYKGIPTSAPCSCSSGTSAPETGIVRALPIEYPPTARLQVEMALPTLSTPGIYAAPTVVPLQS